MASFRGGRKMVGLGGMVQALPAVSWKKLAMAHDLRELHFLQLKCTGSSDGINRSVSETQRAWLIYTDCNSVPAGLENAWSTSEEKPEADKRKAPAGSKPSLACAQP